MTTHTVEIMAGLGRTLITDVPANRLADYRAEIQRQANDNKVVAFVTVRSMRRGVIDSYVVAPE
jgi:hypothetical protein